MPKPVKYHTGKFPPKNLDFERLLPLVGDAREAVGRYDGLLYAIPNSDVMLSPLTTQEAVLSSKIEGTRATMGDVLGFEAGGIVDDLDERMRGDIQEVINYRAAMREAGNLLKKMPLCQRMIKQIHGILLDGVRGHNKHRGKFRTIQNWIGSSDNIEEAKFVPIAPGDPLTNGLDTWEKYIHESKTDPLIQLSLIHVEFESLHPFIDGNGRIGRMIVPIYLFEKKLLHDPMFYVSAYLERNRDEYYQRLRQVSSDDDWTGWCEFFLTAVREQAEDNEKKVREILKLYEDSKSRVIELTHSQHAIHALDYIFDQPIFNSTSFKNGSGIPDSTARRILTLFIEDGLLRVAREQSGKRSRVLVFPELLNITEGKTIF
jgi:Fic family protein